MKLLLDTHAFLWWCADNPRLSLSVIDAVGSEENEVYLSVVSGWEIAIKNRLRRLPRPEKPGTFVPQMIERHRLAVLPVGLRHSLFDAELPCSTMTRSTDC